MGTVYARQYGRLGNNMFQQAAAIGYAQKHGLQYCLEAPPNKNKMVIHEAGHQYQELPYSNEWRHKSIVLDGYWQSEKYFSHCRREVLKELSDEFSWNWKSLSAWCAIHVRRGDYLKYIDKHPVISDVYLCKAIQYMLQLNETMHFTFFSDDIPWCRLFVNEWRDAFPGVQFEFSEGEKEESDLFLMSCHQHQIISNSTFSWWGAWLNQNLEKVVISPSKHNWFGPSNAHLCTDDIIPDSWIQIKY